MLKKNSFKTLVGVALLTLTVIMVFLILPESVPDFWNKEPISFAEMLEEPPSFIYGSSIHVWIYTDNDGIVREIAVTGHADSRTCGLMTGLFFNTYLNKYTEPDDFFVAGAGRLVNTMDKWKLKDMEKNSMIKEYKGKKNMIDFLKIFLNRLRERTTLSETEKTAITQYKGRIKLLEEQILELEENPEVQNYNRQILSKHEFVRFSEEIAKIVESSGLVQVHNIPYGIVDDVKNRILESIKHKNKIIISFDDLLAKYNISDAVVWFDVFQLTNGKPLEIEIPIAALSHSNFEEVKRLNRDEVEIAMIGDARRRIDFFKNEKTDIEYQKGYYSTFSSWELKQKKIELDTEISRDGILIPLPKPKRITAYEYLHYRIPKLIEYVDSLIKETEEIVTKIETDKKQKNDSKIEILNHMTMIDSLLRDWDLPIYRSQKAFKVWRKEQRTPTWRQIIQKLKHKGVSVSGLAGENTIFSVKMKDNKLVISPFQVIDTANSVLILDMDANITRVESTWNNRELIRKKMAPGDSRSMADLEWQNIDDIFSDFSDEFGDKAKNVIIRKLNLNPVDTLKKLEFFQSQVSPEFLMYFSKILKKVGPMNWKKNFLEKYEKLKESPILKENPLKYLDNLFHLLKSYPKAPVDFYLEYAFYTSYIIAYILNENYKEDAQFKPITAWDVVQKCEKKELDCPKGIKEYIERIRESIQIVKKREPGYYDIAAKMKSIPKIQSEEYKKFFEDFIDGFSLFEVGAMDYEDLRSNLITRSFARNAANQLWLKSEIKSTVELEPIIKQIKKAAHGRDKSINPIFANAKERLDDFRNSSNTIDTIASYQIANQIEVGCDLILKKLKELPKRLALPDYSALIARVYYEMGEYKNAFDTLFNSQTSIALYHPQLYWERLEDDWVGYPMNVKAIFEKGQIFVVARDKKEKKRVLKIFGLPENEAKSLCEKINELKNDAWSSIGRVSDQILMTQIPVRNELKRLHKLIGDDILNLAILKTMVYLGVPPASDIVPRAGQDKLGPTERRRYDRIGIGKIQSVVVPSLEELKKIIEYKCL